MIRNAFEFIWDEIEIFIWKIRVRFMTDKQVREHITRSLGSLLEMLDDELEEIAATVALRETYRELVNLHDED